MCQVAAAQIGHLEIDVTQIKSGQISAAEVKALRTVTANVNSTWRTKTVSVKTRVPDSGALTLWASPEGNEQTLSGKWANGPRAAASSV